MDPWIRSSGVVLLLLACSAGASRNDNGSGGATASPTGGTDSGGAQVEASGGSSGGRFGGSPDAGANPDARETGSASGGRSGGMSGGMSGGISGGSAGAAGTGDDAAAQLCVDTINMYRATLGLAPYARWSVEQEACVSREALSDSQTNKAHGAFGMCTENAQNECPGWGGSLTTIVTGCLKQMWAEGPGADFNAHGHYINMSSTKYTRVACGFSTGANGKTWAAQDFK
jgi:hypothetical protein